MKDLKQQMVSIFTELLNSGWHPPIQVSAISANLSTLEARFEGLDGKGGFWAETLSRSPWTPEWPIEISLVDPAGRRALVTIKGSQQTQFTIR